MASASPAPARMSHPRITLKGSGERDAGVMDGRPGPRHHRDVVHRGLAIVPARPHAAIRSFRQLGASKPELARVPLEPGVTVRDEDVDVIEAGRRHTTVQVVALEERDDVLHLAVILDGKAERVPHAQCTALAALLLRP